MKIVAVVLVSLERNPNRLTAPAIGVEVQRLLDYALDDGRSVPLREAGTDAVVTAVSLIPETNGQA